MDRTLNLQPGAGLNVSNNSVQTPPSSSTQVNTPDQFNTAVMGLLTKYQKMGTAGFQRQGMDASQLQADRIAAPTSGNMVGASPTMQNSVRGNAAQAVQPTIDSANNSAQTFGEQLNSFGNATKSAQSYMQTYQQGQQQAKSDAQGIIHDAIAGGSTALAALIQSQPDIVKLAGYTPDTLTGVVSGLQKQEQQTADSKKTFTPIDLGDKIGFYDQQGNLIRTEAKSSPNKGYTEVSPGATLFDPATNKSIFTAPTSAQTTSGNVTGGYTAAEKAQLTANRENLIKAGVKNVPADTWTSAPTNTGTSGAAWGEPYTLGGNIVQRNSTTGEIRTAVNPANTPAPTQADKTQAEYDTINKLMNLKSSKGVPYTTTENGKQYFTPDGYRAIIAATSISTNDFLDKYGNMFGLVYGKDGATVNPNYGLTPAQVKRLGY